MRKSRRRCDLWQRFNLVSGRVYTRKRRLSYCLTSSHRVGSTLVPGSGPKAAPPRRRQAPQIWPSTADLRESIQKPIGPETARTGSSIEAYSEQLRRSPRFAIEVTHAQPFRSYDRVGGWLFDGSRAHRVVNRDGRALADASQRATISRSRPVAMPSSVAIPHDERAFHLSTVGRWT